jgi:hypothetical protein
MFGETRRFALEKNLVAAALSEACIKVLGVTMCGLNQQPLQISKSVRLGL